MRLWLLCAATFTASHAFSIYSFFGSSDELQTPYLHPLSPPEREPMSARAKRQAYQVYVDGDVSVTVDKSGQKETGNWGPWQPEQECSRTCGGGVQSEKRQCSGQCTGPSVRYISCNLDPCSEGTDFRAEQCTKHNDDALDGNYHKWLPYKGKNKCELVCKPEVGNFYYKWADKVVDGTKCDTKSDDICVDGECLPVGCDGKLGSDLKFDKCGVCDGDGSKCKTIEGFFDERNLAPGYHDIIKLPAGATAIKIQEARPSSNNLALKNGSDHYYLNGNGMIQVEKDVEVGGTVFEYDDGKPETLTAKGPLKEELIVTLLFRKGNKDTAIKYEFSIPLDDDVPYMYKPAQWTPCSVTCGKGEQTRQVYCIDTKSQARVNDALCEENNATKPETEKSCETVDCNAEWFTGEWEDCSSTCGDKGEQYRVVYCHQVFANGRRSTVEDENCTSERPPVRQQCNRFSCPEWHAGPWSACSEKCGDAFQYRSVTCRSEKEGEEGKLLPADSCSKDEKGKLDTQRTCNLGPCEGLKFYTTDWKLCQKCNDTEETREVTCKDQMGRAYPLEKCLSDNTTEIPIDTRSCATVQPCVYEWTVSEWSKCSTECGHGHKTRRVVCAIHQLGDLEVVDESHCQGEKPEAKTNCTNEEKCTGTWYAGPWSTCTEECGGGTQNRMTVCLNYDKKPVPEWCDEAEKPEEDQECNKDPCPTCFDSEFGCCPDNTTFATGEFLQGCSNCSISEFGCCADNITDATGPNSKGCEEYVEAPLDLTKKDENKDGEKTDAGSEVEGSAEEAKDEEARICQKKDEMCPVTSGTGDEAMVACNLAQNLTMADDDGLLGNETSGNATIHCSKTQFGCCPDWFTPAEGKNNEGCETFELGVCNGTNFGCCLDSVTLARGKNFEGCGESSCAASLYGCCKDRKTIAFGPHYAGCERSSFPCELSNFGCCPDGETAALGHNGTGCGENCLTTKYGCCPDGVTTAKGHNNEGCGCIYAKYGCCPDGKTSAKGSGFYGCPESCAQSQYGCCPDGKTPARGSHNEGCPCQYTRYGCCPDGETTALGPRNDGCDDCRYAKYGCCDDGSKALGPNGAGCPPTTTPEYVRGGTVAPSMIVQCAQSKDQGSVCHPGYKLVWYYDTTEGRCMEFWYGGCDGNQNRFGSREACEKVCVEPPGIGRCYLPKIEGPLRCDQPVARYWYDYNTRQCAAFWWRGCLGNANNFESWEACSQTCKDVGPLPAEPEPAQPEIIIPPNDPRQAEVPIVFQPAQPDDPRQGAQDPRQQSQPRPRISIEEVCRSNSDPGPCQEHSEAWTFNSYKGDCEQFTYGGCGGNYNRFQTREECWRRCGFLARAAQQPAEQPQAPVDLPRPNVPGPVIPQQPTAADPNLAGKTRDACRLNVDVGRCKGAFESWAYEVATGTCVTFKYTGCGGNQNRFGTKEACEALCLRPAGSEESADGASGANTVCDEAKDTGPCTNFVTKWYYNKADGTCNRFHYGGCQGTGNRFDNEQQCKAACGNHQDACSLPKVQGPCSGKHTVYFYNSASQKCETFTYGGCLGNNNRFATQEECENRCQHETSPAAMLMKNIPSLSLPINNDINEYGEYAREINAQPIDPIPSEVDRCKLKKEVGTCNLSQVKYYYDSAAQMCLQFFWGGCGGNANRFETYEQCKLACEPRMQALRLLEPNPIEKKSLSSSSQERIAYDEINTVSEEQNEVSLQRIEKEEKKSYIPSSPLPELCMLPEEKGPCYDSELRWRYDSESGNCASFMYSGCGHNPNYFTNEESCQRACGTYRDVNVCLQPKSEGDCELAVSKWYYDAAKSSCQLMMWTGCGGNGNKFSSKEDCERLCKEETSWQQESINVCSLPRSAGPCLDSISMWYFDNDQNECRIFTFGGCRGNGNRFLSKSDCELRCGPKMQNLVHVDSNYVCKLPFERGPCDGSESRWFYDHNKGTCLEFGYSGCEGNENRFLTKTDCLAACSVIGVENALYRLQSPPTVTSTGKGSFKAGSEITLTCNNQDQVPIIWYKNNELLVFSERIKEMNDLKDVVISHAAPSDSGKYSCAVGDEGELSNEFSLQVEQILPSDLACVDKGTEAMCSLIVKNKLCGKQRYGSHCCATCSKLGYNAFKPKKL